MSACWMQASRGHSFRICLELRATLPHQQSGSEALPVVVFSLRSEQETFANFRSQTYFFFLIPKLLSDPETFVCYDGA